MFPFCVGMTGGLLRIDAPEYTTSSEIRPNREAQSGKV
jgi:hypothetical protein